MVKIEDMERADRLAAVAGMRKNREELERLYKKNRFDGTVADTVTELVDVLGLDVARGTVAALVLAVSPGDGRVGKAERSWAEQWSPACHDALLRYGLYTNVIHVAHLSQIGCEMMNRE